MNLQEEKSQKAGAAAAAPIHLEQSQIDEIQMKKLNNANRLYRKCISGKCPKGDLMALEPEKKTAKDQLDENLKEIWSKRGREHRLRDLKADIAELEIKLEVATSKPYVVSREKDFESIKKHIEGIKRKEIESEKVKKEIQGLKSQFVRLDQKHAELSRQTESEGENAISFMHFTKLKFFFVLRQVPNASQESKSRKRNHGTTS